jgi:hypothetical protein
MLKDFFTQNGGTPRDEFLESFNGGFLLVRFRETPPLVIFLPFGVEDHYVLGADEDADLDFIADPTLDDEHCKLVYHTGFKGWTIEDLETSFGTHLDGERMAPHRPTLLQDRSMIKPGGGLLELQYYTSAALQKRMADAGVTRSLRRRKQIEEEKDSPNADA